MIAMPWDTSLPDWERRIRNGEPLVPSLPLNREMADKALRIFKRLRVPDLPGMPRLDEVGAPWYFAIVEVLFGSYDPVTKARAIQELFLLVPKKNSKSSYCGPLMLTAVIMNERPSGEFNLIAPTIEIAKIAFRQAVGTIRADPSLVDLFHVRDHLRQIVNRESGAFLQIKAADTDILTGSKSVGNMIDETHVFAEKPKAEDLFLEIRGAMAARPDGFLIQTTTQSKTPPAGAFKAELARARAVRDGRVRMPMLSVLYEYPEADLQREAWRDRSTWGWVNPNLGRSVRPEFLDQQMVDAESRGKSALALFVSQHFNVEIGNRLRDDGWPGADYWADAQDDDPVTLDRIIEECEVAVVGGDGGGMDDLYGLSVIGRRRSDKRWMIWCKAWVQPGALELRKEIAPRLRDFARDGDLVIVDRTTQDVEEFADIVMQLDDAGLLPEQNALGLDPFGVSALIDELDERGFATDRITAVPQGYKLNAAIAGSARKVADGSMIHGAQPLLDWCMSNVRCEQRGNAVIVSKAVSGKSKIDPFVAMLNAFAMMSLNPAASGGASVYAERGIMAM